MKELYMDDEYNKDLHDWKRAALEEFTAKMKDKERAFPCIPATQGHSLNHFRYGFVGDPRKNTSVEELAGLLTKYTQCSREFGKYTSLILFFETPKELVDSYTVEQFEQLFWNQLNGLSEIDKFEWPSQIPTDPHHPIWEFCYNKEQYFMFCGTPAHQNRRSRNSSCFMLAITPRWVLEEFNSSPTLASKIKSRIRKRLLNYDSIDIHPDLNSYGREDNYEWKQYFLHDDDTSLSKCPFHKFLRLLGADKK
jgi:FPC/CPF motif-containing protein YcgG